MITVDITNEIIERAKDLYPFDNLKGSITRGEGNIYGAIGEILIWDHFTALGYDVQYHGSYDYDIVINGSTVDVKTKHTTVKPQMDYLCSISAFNTSQNCDYYFFVRVMKDMSKGYLLGYLLKKDFYEVADFNKKGTEDINGWLFKDDCYNVEVRYLNKFKPLPT